MNLPSFTVFYKTKHTFFHITRACLFQGNASSVAVLAMIVCKAALALWKDKEDDKGRVLMEGEAILVI